MSQKTAVIKRLKQHIKNLRNWNHLAIPSALDHAVEKIDRIRRHHKIGWSQLGLENETGIKTLMDKIEIDYVNFIVEDCVCGCFRPNSIEHVIDVNYAIKLAEKHQLIEQKNQLQSLFQN